MRVHKEITLPASVLEHLLALFSVLFGAWTLFLDQSTVTSAYSILLERAAYWNVAADDGRIALGLFSIMAGSFYSIAVYINGRGLTWTPFIRGIASAGGMFFYAYVSAGFYAVNPQSTAVLTYAFISTCFFLLFVVNLHRISEAIELLKEMQIGKRRDQ